jgi:superoxide dismutase, Fe-Mn family
MNFSVVAKRILNGSRPLTINLSKSKCRKLHTVPELAHIRKNQGISGLLSASGVDVAWFQYQQFLMDRLNESAKGTSAEDLSLYQIIQQTAENPDLKPLNYYASQAYNNQFFFESLRESVNPDAEVSSRLPDAKDADWRKVDISQTVRNTPSDALGAGKTSLMATISDSFDSILAFREQMINRASAMFGNGYTWLVTTDNTFHVLNTYNHGTPFRQNKDNALSNGNFGNDMRNLVPLVSINTWQHVYLTDYGVAGKRRFIENAFDCLDWSVVLKRLPQEKTHLSFKTLRF